MKKNTTSKLWFIAAISFMISGLLDKNVTFITLGCAFTVFGCKHIQPKHENKESNKTIC